MNGFERLRNALPSNRWFAAGLALFPIALVAGLSLMVRNLPPAPVRATVDCAQAIETSRAFLIHAGAPAKDWEGSCRPNTDNSLIAFANANPERRDLWRVAPPISVIVKFHPPGHSEAAHVKLTVEGQVVGFGRDDLSSYEPLSGPESVALARTYLPAGITYSDPSVFETKSGRREYTFRSSQVPGSRLSTTVKLEGRAVRSVETESTMEDSRHESSAETAQTALSVVGGIFACIVAVFSIYRYAARTLQQEVSHQRSLIVALFCGAFAVLLGMNAMVESSDVNISLWIILLVFALMGIVGGTVVAAAYGSGEGDVREAFPGKLTSLDALLTGRLYSFNTGASILVGLACAGWLVLALGLLEIPFRTTAPFASASITGPFIRLHWLMPFVSFPLFALGIVAAGLMQPAAFVQRNLSKSPRRRIAILVLCTAFASLLRAHSPSTGDFLVSSLVYVVAVLAPFFLYDLLSTLICVTTLFSVTGLATSLTVASTFVRRSVEVHTAIAAGLTIFAIAAVMRGKKYTEEQVRPLYAKHIVERKSLEAEVSAAREAQLRLLPEKLPEFAGLYISAACVPAETVGGDFYDFFPLGNGRLGVFLAEGNNRALAAALTIALAKGYLMQCVEKTHEPVDILTRLEALLSSIFAPAEGGVSDSALTEFAFASIDTVAGALHYARTGAYPKVVIVSGTSRVAMERGVAIRGRSVPITEGRATLAPGDHVVLFTDGIGRRLALGNRKPEDAATDLILKTPSHLGQGALGTDELCHRFLDTAKGAVDPDDLTLVVIQMHALAQSEGGTLEAVA